MPKVTKSGRLIRGAKRGIQESPSSPCARLGTGQEIEKLSAGSKQKENLGNTHEPSNPLIRTNAFQRRLQQTVVVGRAQGVGDGVGQESREDLALNTHGHGQQQPEQEGASRKERNATKHRIDRLERSEKGLKRSEQRLKKQLQEKAEHFKDVKVEVTEMRTEWLKAEERLEEAERLLHLVNTELDRYRGWWLTEHYCLKVVLKLVPEGEKSGVEAIAASSQARFQSHSK